METEAFTGSRTCPVQGDRNAMGRSVPRGRTTDIPNLDAYDGRPVSGERVLVIDDEAAIRLLCRVNLEADGMEVLEAADGPAGVELARAERPDAIVLDLLMPRLDGRGVLGLLRGDERTASIPVVVLTALGERDVEGAAVLAKPFDPLALAPLIRSLL